jgi:site-specific recombinase XerD
MWIEEWSDYLRAVEGRAASTVSQYARVVGRVGAALGTADPREWTFGGLEGHLRALYVARRSSATRALVVAAVRSYCAYLVARGDLERSPARDLRRPRVYTREADVLTPAEVERLIYGPLARGLDRAELAVRDRVLLGLMYVLGLRSSEPGRIEVGDLGWDEDERVFAVRLRGRKWQGEDVRLWADEDVSRLLGAYVESVRPALGKSRHLFPGGGEAAELSRTTVARAFRRRVQEAGIEARGRQLSPHTLRHSIATHLLDAGVNPRVVQRHLCHQSLETTMRYMHSDRARMAKEWRRRHPIKGAKRREKAVSMHTAVRQFLAGLGDLAGQGDRKP